MVRALGGSVRRRGDGAVQMVSRTYGQSGGGGNAGKDLAGRRRRRSVAGAVPSPDRWLAAQPGRERGGAVLGRGAAAATPSPNPSSANCASASSTSSACGPDAVTRSVSPKRAPMRDHVREAGRLHRRAVWRLSDAHVGLEPPDGLDESRRGARVETDRVAHLEHGLRVGRRSGRRRLGGSARHFVGDPQLRALHRERAARLRRHLVERRAAARRSGGRHRALDQRRLAHHHASRGVVEQLDRKLRAHQRAAEVHQHEHAVRRHRALDRRPHALGVGPQHARFVSSTGRFELERVGAHFPRERHHALCERRAVGDDDDPDHLRRTPRAETQSP